MKWARRNPKIVALYDRGWEGLGYSSPSEADLALASLLTAWSRDAEQIERLMRSSALYREKWDDHRDYLERTITTALASTHLASAPEPQGEDEPPPEYEASPSDSEGKDVQRELRRIRVRKWAQELLRAEEAQAAFVEPPSTFTLADELAVDNEPLRYTIWPDPPKSVHRE